MSKRMAFSMAWEGMGGFGGVLERNFFFKRWDNLLWNYIILLPHTPKEIRSNRPNSTVKCLTFNYLYYLFLLLKTSDFAVLT